MNSRIEKTDGRDYSAGGAYYEDVSGWKGGCGKVSTGGEAHNRSVFFFKESFILVECSTQQYLHLEFYLLFPFPVI